MGINMIAPSLGEFVTSGNHVYRPDAQGFLIGVETNDVLDLVAHGCATVPAPLNVGFSPTPGVTVVEQGDVYSHVTTVIFDSAVLPEIPVGAWSTGIPIYTFPAGIALLDSAHMIAGLISETVPAATPEVAVGTVVGDGVNAAFGDTRNYDIVPAHTLDDCAGDVTKHSSALTLTWDQDATERSIYLNVVDIWPDPGDPAMRVTGSVTLSWRTALY